MRRVRARMIFALSLGLSSLGGCHDDRTQCREIGKQIQESVQALLAVEAAVAEEEAVFEAAVRRFEAHIEALLAVPAKDLHTRRVRAADEGRKQIVRDGRAVVEGLRERRALRAADPSLSLKLIGPAAQARAGVGRILRVPVRCD